MIRWFVNKSNGNVAETNWLADESNSELKHEGVVRLRGHRSILGNTIFVLSLTSS